MVIDVRTRVWTGEDPLASAPLALPLHSLPAEADPTPRGLHRAESIVDASIVAAWRIDRLGVHTPAEQLARWLGDSSGARLGFAGIDPTSESVWDEFDAAVELGMAGLTIAPADQACRPTDDRFLAVAERAAAAGLPLLVANPCLASPQSVLEFARPSLLDDAMRLVPNLTIVLGDLGGGFTEEAFAMLAKHPRAFAETSGVISQPWTLYTTLLSAFERRVIDKLLFGSGFPHEMPERAVERLYTVNAVRAGSSLPGIPREALRGIVERDSLRLLGIEDVAAGRRAVHQAGDAPKPQASPLPRKPAPQPQRD